MAEQTEIGKAIPNPKENASASSQVAGTGDLGSLNSVVVVPGALGAESLPEAMDDVFGPGGEQHRGSWRQAARVATAWARREVGMLDRSQQKVEDLEEEIRELRKQLEEERIKRAVAERDVKKHEDRASIFGITSIVGAGLLALGNGLSLAGMIQYGYPLLGIGFLLLILPFLIRFKDDRASRSR